jgi:hypothetical protein
MDPATVAIRPDTCLGKLPYSVSAPDVTTRKSEIQAEWTQLCTRTTLDPLLLAFQSKHATVFGRHPEEQRDEGSHSCPASNANPPFPLDRPASPSRQQNSQTAFGRHPEEQRDEGPPSCPTLHAEPPSARRATHCNAPRNLRALTLLPFSVSSVLNLYRFPSTHGPTLMNQTFELLLSQSSNLFKSSTACACVRGNFTATPRSLEK